MKPYAKTLILKGMRIPLFEIRDNGLTADIETAALNVLRSGHYLMGPHLKEFENNLASYHSHTHAIGVANGTDALAIGMLALGLQQGDRVATVANAGSYTSFAANMIGAIPVLADIDPITHQMNASSLEKLISRTNVQAIVVTHLYGLMASIKDILNIASKHNIPIIEDVAQAMGAELDGKKAGSFGTLATFSFYPTKNLGACGDAGGIGTNDTKIADKVRALRQYGWVEKYCAKTPMGRNSRIDEMQAAILNIKIKKLNDWNIQRRAIWTRYRDAGLTMIGRNDQSFIAHLCVAQSEKAAEWQKHLEHHGISTAIHYPVKDYEQPALQGIVETPVPLGVTKETAGKIFTLPCFPEMREEEITYICDVIKKGIA